MHTSRTAATLTAVAAAATLGVTSAAGAATSQGVSGADVRFLTSNTQVDLAEITLGRIVLSRSDDPDARELATTTISDHQVALGKVRTIARRLDVTLPTEPNAMQQQVAAELSTISADLVPVTYFTAQIAGHKKSIAQTKHELADGSKQTVVTYAAGYLPVATMHLQMSRQDLAAATNL